MTDVPQMDFEMKAINSSSGNSFLGRTGSQKVFVKLNASPLLPTLATEGITPKIVWIRKTPNGDTLSAQTWIEGRNLETADMCQPQVAQLLSQFHTSKTLRDSLASFSRSVERPSSTLNFLLTGEGSPIKENHYLREIAEKMSSMIPVLNHLDICVIHRNASPDNWILEEKTGKIYLVDWETVGLGDPFNDIGYILSHFIAFENWASFMSAGNYNLYDVAILSKIRWYGQLSFLLEIYDRLKASDTLGANSEILGLRKFREHF